MNKDERPDMTVGMKVMVLTIFICCIGLFVGLTGLMADWALAKSIGAVSLVVVVTIIWAAPELVGEKLMDRFLYGRKNKSRDEKDA
ncbi:hypothetical protein [Aliirhizobium smilacinae]|jgi:hypothetical protein|uniref:Uncharacterized protein n=1 Tax=Aliirhizobium smilacinae TaxID=1395944 RepID=A0A5C4XMV6_9HYPH|nr:hypothetical protein [Rhizobium smilacinae]TNM64752.1 hypothetical protein FHP24_00085 [Rhizobium smilacinae]